MITAVDITKVEANRTQKELIANMKFNINFESVKVESENVNVEFVFTALYDGASSSKEIGKLVIGGNILAKESKKDAEEIAKKWKDEKTLPLKFAEDVINMLNFECAARGTLVAYSIGFVAPLPLSRAKLTDQEK